MDPSTPRPRRKLLVATAGLATLVCAACDGTMSSGNLMPPQCPTAGKEICCPSTAYLDLCCPDYPQLQGCAGGGGSGGQGGSGGSGGAGGAP